ncbi:catalase [Chitinophaga pendula]|uniref:catalase n=1 Tax=Chitinophaga TaxID=79328 RepID=UPI000BAEF514|nr:MULTISPECIES: catalase [Chitinophaga]ASZ11019.1 catalase HPII [Chitinophaga sp. MD30]UCJ05985.1 catalase [Chitinophaga pendula]
MAGKKDKKPTLRKSNSVNKPTITQNDKIDQLQSHTEDSDGQFLTTNQGVRINDNQNTLKAGDRGPSLLEDFIFREKITHFDHERIPERIVHARGTAAHGYFQVYKSMSEYTRADFLQNPDIKTPVFVRFSTVAGSRGSTDLARDVRGFAVKFYTREGNFDLVGNNIPVFFIQDAIKFPDLIHAAKPEPHNEIPQAATAHNTFWDFVSVMPESMHMIMWAMSDRAIPRSLRMMEGFGVHTFRFINHKGKSTFVKFHWKPLLGVHSVAWDEATKISGKDPDFHRRDLWEAIENGIYPEWEFGVQLVPEEDEHKFDFDLLDPTKIIPEEIIPVQRIGKLTLDRNPDNFFAETEQVAFHPGHIVPGIDFTNDPLLQGRLFSYTDTQLIRLGGPNFHEIPINRPIAPVHNNQRDGYMRQTINRGETSYEPNSIRGGCPFQAKWSQGGFASHTEKIDAQKIRGRSRSFFDHFSQAALFFHSQSEAEQTHIVNALRFELGKVEIPAIRQRVVGLLTQVDKKLAARVAEGLGIPVPKAPEQPINRSIPADGDPKDFQPHFVQQAVDRSEALSMANTIKNTIRSRQIAILVADGVDEQALEIVKKALTAGQAQVKLIAPHQGTIKGNKGSEIPVDQSLLIAASVLFDAVYLPGGKKSTDILKASPDAIHFVNEAYRHCKAIAADDEGINILLASYVGNKLPGNGSPNASAGLIVNKKKPQQTAKEFPQAIAKHRFWEREQNDIVPA